MDYSHYCLKRKPKRKTWAPCSLQLLQKDHERFLQSGGDLKNAQKFHNCIGEPFFNIPLTQVIINGNNVYKASRTSCLFVFFTSCVCLDYTYRKESSLNCSHLNAMNLIEIG